MLVGPASAWLWDERANTENCTEGERPVAEPGQQFTIEMPSGVYGRLTGDIYHPDTIASFKVTCAVSMMATSRVIAGTPSLCFGARPAIA